MEKHLLYMSSFYTHKVLYLPNALINTNNNTNSSHVLTPNWGKLIWPVIVQPPISSSFIQAVVIGEGGIVSLAYGLYRF